LFAQEVTKLRSTPAIGEDLLRKQLFSKAWLVKCPRECIREKSHGAWRSPCRSEKTYPFAANALNLDMMYVTNLFQSWDVWKHGNTLGCGCRQGSKASRSDQLLHADKISD